MLTCTKLLYKVASRFIKHRKGTRMSNYKKIISAIKNLKWEKLSVCELETLMVLAAYSAREFAESLRISLELYPESYELQEMAKGELMTSNLMFDDYNKNGDHADFLWYFINKHELTNRFPKANEAGERYLRDIRLLSKPLRAMTIVSRERELPGIFKRILKAKNWSTPALKTFRHYIQEHIRIDSMEGGHAELLSGHVVTEEVEKFYMTRLKLYKTISTL